MKTMNKLAVMAVMAVGMAAMAQDAMAQGYARRTVNGGGFSGGGFNNGGYRRVPSGPVYPIFQQNSIDGFNPSGGLDTSGVTVFNSVNDPGRNSSRFNGSRRQVNEPIFSNGRVVGWRQGEEWVNSFNGRDHFRGQVITDNGMGGVNREAVAYGKEGE